MALNHFLWLFPSDVTATLRTRFYPSGCLFVCTLSLLAYLISVFIRLQTTYKLLSLVTGKNRNNDK